LLKLKSENYAGKNQPGDDEEMALCVTVSDLNLAFSQAVTFNELSFTLFFVLQNLLGKMKPFQITAVSITT
jgi:hypothetical protein